MKIGLCVILIALFGMLGYGFSETYISRKKFFHSALIFFEKIKGDISFLSKNTLSILNECEMGNFDKNFVRIITNYKKILLTNENIDKKKLFNGVTILYDDEEDIFLHFFNNFGKSDLSTQIERINQMLNICNNLYINSSDECKKKSSICIKLGLIIGTFVSILIM